jgi:hypothetical protein
MNAGRVGFVVRFGRTGITRGASDCSGWFYQAPEGIFAAEGVLVQLYGFNTPGIADHGSQEAPRPSGVEGEGRSTDKTIFFHSIFEMGMDGFRFFI